LDIPPRANAAGGTRRAERWSLLSRRAPDPGGVDAKPLLVLNCHSCITRLVILNAAMAINQQKSKTFDEAI
jgi:hypothetical protein